MFWPEDAARDGRRGARTGARVEGSAFHSGWFLRLDGSACPMDLQASRVPWGRTEAIIVTLRDVTERHQAQQRLSEEKEQLATTLRSIGEAVATTDVRGRIALLNGVAEELTGWTQQEAVWTAARRGLAVARRPRCQAVPRGSHRRAAHAAAWWSFPKTISLRSRHGRECALALTAAPIRRHEDGLISGLVMVFRDMTSEQKLEEERYRKPRNWRASDCWPEASRTISTTS